MRTYLAVTTTFFLLLVLGCQKQDASSGNKQGTIVRVGSNAEPHSVDPRSARLLADATLLSWLYEGLLREDAEGNLEPALAHSMDVSPDGKTYRFVLRKAQWANGLPLTSYDFASAWKSQLHPDFAAPNAFQLYVIKNAREIKEGRLSTDSLGVETPDAHTLVVHLVQPTAFFPRLTAFHAFFPIQQSLANSSPTESEFTFNGPFLIEQWAQGHQISLRKNPNYWDAENINIDGIEVFISDENTALELFETGELHWAGSPLSVLPTEALDSLDQEGWIHSTPAAATHWIRVNVEDTLLSNRKIRQALALAVHRQELMDHVVQGNQRPAMGILPSNAHWSSPEYFEDHDIESAKELWAEGLAELDLPPNYQPQLTFTYNRKERDHMLAQALQQQWYEALNLWVELEGLEGKLLFEKLKNQDYQLASGSWFADFDDPINFLSVFESRDNGTNNTGWEDLRYQELLNASTTEQNAFHRRDLLLAAEARLMEEMPVIPLFFYQLNAVKQPELTGVRLSGLGILRMHSARLNGP